MTPITPTRDRFYTTGGRDTTKPGASLWRLAYRLPYGDAVAGWPLALRSVGHAVTDDRYRESVRARPILLVLWCLAGRVRVERGRRVDVVDAGGWLWLEPGQEHRIASAASTLELRWLSVDGPAVAAWAAAWDPPAGAARPGEPLATGIHDWLLDAIEGAGRERRLACLDRTTALLAAGLTDAADGLREAVALEIDRHHADPAFGVAALARRLGIHRSHLARRLVELGAPPPSRQLRARRIAAAQGQLTAGESVAAAAAASGFGGPDQLARAFRAEVGATPRSWLQRGRGMG